jgi:hypothetical protein
MIYTAPYVMLLMRANPLRGQGGVGWALEIETFLGPVKWHRAVRRVPFGAQKSGQCSKLTYIKERSVLKKKYGFAADIKGSLLLYMVYYCDRPKRLKTNCRIWSSV